MTSADEYATGRQNIWFTANNSTPADGNLTGQCVTLVKWFFNDVISGFPRPFAARGNAKDIGRTLVAQGLAYKVGYGDRQRGDIICYEYGRYGHTAVQLSGGRVFESNVKWSGVATKLDSTGDRVYASRIGNENEAWRSTRNPHVYRLKGYSEGGNDDMITRNDVAPVRIIMSEVEGWNMDNIHSGKNDALIMGAWTGQKWQDFIYHCWTVQHTHRGHLENQIRDLNQQVGALSSRPTVEEVAALKVAVGKAQVETDAAKKVAADSKASTDKLVAQSQADQETGNSFLRWLGNQLNKLTGGK